MIKEFEIHTDATSFIFENYQLPSLNEKTKTLAGSIQSHQLYEGDSYDDMCIAAIRQLFDQIAPVPFDLVVWRAGDMRCKHRLFVPASFLKEVADDYSNNNQNKVHKIIVKKGSKIFPLLLLGKDYGEKEAEIIIETSRLKRKLGYYTYE